MNFKEKEDRQNTYASTHADVSELFTVRSTCFPGESKGMNTSLKLGALASLRSQENFPNHGLLENIHESLDF